MTTFSYLKINICLFLKYGNKTLKNFISQCFVEQIDFTLFPYIKESPLEKKKYIPALIVCFLKIRISVYSSFAHALVNVYMFIIFRMIMFDKL